MIRTLKLTEFIEPARRGITQPLVIRAAADEGPRETVYLKSTAGYGDRPQAAGMELFSTLIARKMGLNAPEPVLIEVPIGAERMVYDSPKHATLIERSAGLNFGTISLGNDWKVWLPGMSIRLFSTDDIENILAFDALVQHTDREANNPNLMWKGQEMAILDHEKVFGYVSQSKDPKCPWRKFFETRPLERHVLSAYGRKLMHPDFGKKLWENILEMECGGGFDECLTLSETSFPAAKVDLQRIRTYLTRLAADAGDFFKHLEMSLQP